MNELRPCYIVIVMLFFVDLLSGMQSMKREQSFASANDAIIWQMESFAPAKDAVKK
jgi:hypothetical protein